MEKLTKIELKFDGHDLESIFLVNTDFNSRGFIVSSPLFEEGQELRLYGQKLKEETSYFNSVTIAGNENNILIPNEVLTDDDDNSFFIRLKFELLGTNKKLNTETVILRVNSTFQGSQVESELSELRYELSIKDKLINDFRLELAGIQNKELERESAEVQRKENEELRVNAETDRVTTFDNLTTDINSEFNDLKTKNTEIENAERTRVEQEQTRVDNENLRIQAEIDRENIIANLDARFDEKANKDQVDLAIENIIDNGNFIQGLDAWKGLLSGLTVVNEDKLSGGVGVEFRSLENGMYDRRLRQEKELPQNDLIYFGAKINISALEGSSDIRLRTCSYGSYDNNIEDNRTIGSAKLGEWDFLSVIRNVPQGDIGLRFEMTVYTSEYVSMVAGDFIAINLTDTFGKGNEPTKAEIEELIKILGGWFDGEITLTQKQLAIWTLNMIRQNRNAIVALGGAIV